MGEPWARTKAVRLSPARVRGEYDAWGCEKRGQYRSSLLTDIPVTSCLSRDMMGDQSVFRFFLRSSQGEPLHKFHRLLKGSRMVYPLHTQMQSILQMGRLYYTEVL